LLRPDCHYRDVAWRLLCGWNDQFLYSRKIRVFDYARFAEPLRDRIRARAQEVCAEAGIEIEHINKPHIRKEGVVAKVLSRRGDHAGLVHVISAMEACHSYKPWHDKASGRTFLKPDSGKCLHYYFCFIDEKLGLCYLRVPTWCPFRLQFYCNGHLRLNRPSGSNIAQKPSRPFGFRSRVF